MPTRLSWFLFYCLVVVVCAFIVVSSESLPAIVAANFDMSGISSGQTPRESYRNLMIGTVLFLAALHMIVFWCIGKLPASLINLPNKEIWLSPENGESTMRYITNWGIAMGCLTMLVFASIHAAVIVAHRVSPPTMPNAMLVTLLGAIGIAFCVMLVMLIRRFGSPMRK